MRMYHMDFGWEPMTQKERESMSGLMDLKVNLQLIHVKKLTVMILNYFTGG